MAAKADCKITFNNNVANITSNYDKGVIDITTAKILYQRELDILAKCSSGDMSAYSIPNPFEATIVNYRFIKQLIIKQGLVKTFFNVGDIVKGETLNNGNVSIEVNGQKIEISKDYVEETSENVTKITSETEAELRRMNPMYSTWEKVAIGFLVFFVFLLFIKLLKVI